MRVVVIGAGSIGKRHLANLCALGHEAVALDESASACTWALQQGFETHRLYDADVRTIDGFQAAIIATPAASHLEWLEACVCGRMPVLVEKPLGVLADLSALRELRPAAPVMVAYQLRFHPALQALKASVPRPTGGGFYLDCDMKEWPGQSYEPIILEGSHELDAALFCGAPQVVNREDTLTLTDTRATFWLGDGDERWLIDLDGACSTYLRHWMLGPSEAPPTKFHSPAELGDQMYIDELTHFLRAVEGGPIAPGCTLEEGIAVLEVVRQVKELETVTR